MHSKERRRFSRLTSALLLIGAVAVGTAHAQNGGSVRGIVVDVSGAVIIGAEVSVTGIPYRSVTDERGVFQLSGSAVGALVTVSARRLGFTPVSVSATASDLSSSGGLLRIEMKRAPF